MTNPNLENLPPEMQARLAQIMQQAQAGVPPSVPAPQAPIAAPAPAPAPLVKPPSLMDHVIALRQEVNQLSQQVAAAGRVTEAVGNAVGELYATFQAETAPTSYSSGFQAQRPSLDDAEY